LSDTSKVAGDWTAPDELSKFGIHKNQILTEYPGLRGCKGEEDIRMRILRLLKLKPNETVPDYTPKTQYSSGKEQFERTAIKTISNLTIAGLTNTGMQERNALNKYLSALSTNFQPKQWPYTQPVYRDAGADQAHLEEEKKKPAD
jgi:hypothetical protein